jgi:hypothetical protein
MRKDLVIAQILGPITCPDDGSRSDRGLETAAILYSLIQTCLKIDVDPEKYLVEAIRARRLEGPRTLLPSDLKADSTD